jgi:hypothetical protein
MRKENMNSVAGITRTSLIAMLGLCSAFLVCPGTSAALQDTTVKNVAPSGESTVTTEVKSGEVVYASGNDVVVKVENGAVENFTVPEGFKFQVEGKELTAQELQPGMRLTQTITTTSTPHLVKSVRTIKGKVWHVNAPDSVILRLPDQTNKKYNVPKGQQFQINGEKLDIFHLKKGMNITATVITESPTTVTATTQNVTGQNPIPKPETPPMVGVLLIQLPPETEKTEVAEAEQPRLPNTASELPLLLLLSALSIGCSIVFRPRHYRRPS